MRHDLTPEQTRLLIERLRAAKVRPGLLITALWQFGWLVPPFIMLPLIAYTAFYLAWVAICYGIMLFSLASGGYAFDQFTLLALGGLIVLGNLVRYLVVRSRGQALLVAACFVSVLLAYFIALFLRSPMIDGDMLARVMASRLAVNLIGVTFGIAIGAVIRYYRLRRKRGGLAWRALLNEVLVTEAF